MRWQVALVLVSTVFFLGNKTAAKGFGVERYSSILLFSLVGAFSSYRNSSAAAKANTKHSSKQHKVNKAKQNNVSNKQQSKQQTNKVRKIGTSGDTQIRRIKLIATCCMQRCSFCLLCLCLERPLSIQLLRA